jgi:phosphoribosylanthranilate isomerase
MKIKVCGMKYKKNIEQVVALHPDYLGFIFYERSKRHFEGSIPTIPDSIKKTGVFVNAEHTFIRSMVQKHTLNTVQLHGEESALDCKNLKDMLGPEIEIIKAFAISDDFDFSDLNVFMPFCDFFLFDTKGKERGGNGILFDWNVLQRYDCQKPYFLSGGIGLEQSNQIKSFLNSKASEYCYAIDVNSKFESEPGIKKIKELKNFIELTKT